MRSSRCKATFTSSAEMPRTRPNHRESASNSGIPQSSNIAKGYQSEISEAASCAHCAIIAA